MSERIRRVSVIPHSADVELTDAGFAWTFVGESSAARIILRLQDITWMAADLHRIIDGKMKQLDLLREAMRGPEPMRLLTDEEKNR